ncbi:MAG: rhomboid family intramembrane serine protease [Verrucomicrobiota bacterium]
MLYDRPYMKSEFEPRRLGFVAWFAIICGALFLIESISEAFFPGFGVDAFTRDWLALGITNLQDYKVWTLFTYAFLHGGLLHIIFNLLLIILIGRQLEHSLGEKQTTYLLAAGIVAGALAFLAVNFNRPGSYVLGASAGAMALLTTFCLLNYERPLTFLLFLIVPVTLRAKWILWGLVGIDSFMLLTSEIPGTRGGIAIAHSAHLGGAIAGFVYYRYFLGHATNNPFAHWFKAKPKSRQQTVRAEVVSNPRESRFNYRPKQQTVNLSNRNDVQKEVDRILDKINTQGFGSLNAEEKETLERARDMLSK